MMEIAKLKSDELKLKQQEKKEQNGNNWLWYENKRRIMSKFLGSAGRNDRAYYRLKLLNCH